MSAEILQVRDVPSDDVRTLRARARSRNMSLSAYLRELIHDETSRPLMSEALERIAGRDRVEVGGEEIRAFIDDGRS